MHNPDDYKQVDIIPHANDQFQVEWTPRGRVHGVEQAVLYVSMNGVTLMRIGPVPVQHVDMVNLRPTF